MGRVFISTLGATRYSECRYKLNAETTSDSVTFVQEAVIRNICKKWDFSKGDRIKILCTETARTSNWEDNGHKNRGTNEIIQSSGLGSTLQRILKEPDYLNLKYDEIRVSIPEGKDETEIWDIFDILYKQLDNNDDVWFDITHSFRSIPMLVLVAITYARVMKNIHVKSITYGAYEAKPKDDLVAPVFDLTQFVNLMDWTNAAKDFIDYGQTKQLIKMLSDEVNPLLKESKGSDSEAKLSNAVGKNIKDISDSIQKNDLAAIVNLNKLKENLNLYKKNVNSKVKAFIPIVEKIEEKVEPFAEDSLGNVFSAARWCVNHGMYQNAYSILLEGCISIALNSVGQTKNVTFAGDSSEVRMDIENKRELVKFAAQVKAGRKKESDLNDSTRHLLPLLINIMSIIPIDIANHIIKLSNYRNGYMHCGTGTEPIPKGIVDELSVFLPNLEAWYITLKGKINE